jgi:hypothetical protein
MSLLFRDSVLRSLQLLSQCTSNLRTSLIKQQSRDKLKNGGTKVPPFFFATRNSSAINTSSTALTDIGIDSLRTQIGTTHVADTSLDCVIVRKSDRKAVRLTITGTNRAHYENMNASTTITAIAPDDGPWTPEVGRLVNMGYIG